MCDVVLVRSMERMTIAGRDIEDEAVLVAKQGGRRSAISLLDINTITEALSS